jgi:hypothetical protein
MIKELKVIDTMFVKDSVNQITVANIMTHPYTSIRTQTNLPRILISRSKARTFYWIMIFLSTVSYRVVGTS